MRQPCLNIFFNGNFVVLWLDQHIRFRSWRYLSHVLAGVKYGVLHKTSCQLYPILHRNRSNDKDFAYKSDAFNIPAGGATEQTSASYYLYVYSYKLLRISLHN